MPINFPYPAVDGQVFTHDDVSWIYDSASNSWSKKGISAAQNTTYDLGSGTTLSVGETYYASISSDRTLTFSGTPSNMSSVTLWFDCDSEITLTFPSSYRLGYYGAITSLVFPAASHVIRWIYMNGTWHMADSVVDTSGSDSTPPTLTYVAISSSNAAPTLAKAGDTITVSFTASESIKTPTVKILNRIATVAGGTNNQWTATVTVAGGDTGTVPFTIDFSDQSNNAGTRVTATTNGSGVTADTTAPALSGVSASAGNAIASMLATPDSGGTVYWLVDTNSTRTPAQVIAGGGTYSHSDPCAAGVQVSRIATGLSNGTTYYAHVAVKDLAGNVCVAASDTLGFIPTAVDTTPPSVLSGSSIGVDGTTLTLLFSEAVHCPSGTVTGLNVDVSGGAQNIACSYVSGSGTATVVLSLASVVGAGQTCDLDYTQPGGGIYDMAISPNDMVTFANMPLTNNSAVDITPPTLSTATIGSDGTSLTLTFSENVAIGAGGSGGMSITASVSGTIAVTLGTPSGGSIACTLASSVQAGEVFTVSYVQPGHGVEDLSGNDLASVSGWNVSATNNSGLNPNGYAKLVDVMAEGPTLTTTGTDTTGCTLLVAMANFYSNGDNMISDSKNNVWIEKTPQIASFASVRLYYCIAPTVGAGHTFTVSNGNGGGVYMNLAVLGFSKLAPVFDAEASGYAGNIPVQPGSISPSSSDDLFVTACGCDLATVLAGLSIDSGFTIARKLASSGNNCGALAYKVKTTASSENPTWSAAYGTGNPAGGCVMLAFK